MRERIAKPASSKRLRDFSKAESRKNCAVGIVTRWRSFCTYQKYSYYVRVLQIGLRDLAG